MTRDRKLVKRRIEESWVYTRVVKDLVKEERMHDSCRVRRESLDAVCIGCVLLP